MPQDPYERHDAAATSVYLAAESAVLEARVRMLQSTLDTVDTRIRQTSERLRRLRLAPPSPAAGQGVPTDAPA
jgi:hypothetical protein